MMQNLKQVTEAVNALHNTNFYEAADGQNQQCKVGEPLPPNKGGSLLSPTKKQKFVVDNDLAVACVRPSEICPVRINISNTNEYFFQYFTHAFITILP